ncbi:MAG TPA: TlpA disulfide reductase family protein [Kofleriaceae bacterium]|jgi:thiol-disulfide isomerase/thioredoxin
MDRLSAVILVLLAACDSSKEPPPPPSRTEGVQQHVDPGAADKAVEAFCDHHAKTDAEAKAFVWPTGSQEPEHAAGQWRWINVWATWCHPCIDELPLLATWSKDLAGKGHPIALEFLSADDSDEPIAPFRTQHAEVADAARLPDGDPRGAWFQSLGMDASPPIPVHVLVSPAGKVRCTRAGSIRAKDFAAVQRLLSE